jgi:hypothetical protein
MRYALILAACLSATAQSQELPDADPEVQSQIKKTYDAMHRLGVVTFDNAEVLSEAQKVKLLVADDDEIVRQLAVFVATTESSEDTHAIVALSIWRYLHVSPFATIRVLAPYLDASDRSLRGFVRDWFQGYDKAENFEDYKKYVMWRVSRKEEIPVPFIEYMYRQSPGQAVLTLQSGSVDIRKQIEVVQEGRTLTQEEHEQQRLQQQERREILLAEHIVSNALWLHANKFNGRFQAALPEAMAELEKLANHKQWWARLYVVHIMRRHPELLQDHILRKLAEDENELVSKAAERRAAPNPGDGRRAEPPIAPREGEARAVGPTSIEVTWQPSVGATSYKVIRRQPDTETEYTIVAQNVTGTRFIDTGLSKDTLYEYRVSAQQDAEEASGSN